MLKYLENRGSRFADEHEIKQSAKPVDCREANIRAAGLPVLAESNNRLWVLDHDLHTLIIGATGSMKTRRLVMPSLALMIKRGESIIVNDPKGELYRYLKPLLDHMKYPTHVLNFRTPGAGARWNPLAIADQWMLAGNRDKSNEYIRDFARSLYARLAANSKDAFWTDVSEDYFVGLAQIIRDCGEPGALTLENIIRANYAGHERFGNSRLINAYFDEAGKMSEAYTQVESVINAPNDTRECIRSVFNQPLGLYCQYNLLDMLSRSEFDLAGIGRQKTAVFLVTPDEKTIYNPIIAAFIKQCYQVLIDTAEDPANGFAGVLPVRVNFTIDEFGNLPVIEDMNAMISAARSRNIRFNLVLQSASQLYNAYGREVADNLMANCEAWFYLKSKDWPLLEKISSLCGSVRTELVQEEMPLLSVTQLQRLSKRDGETLILLDGHYPFMTCLPDISAYEWGGELSGSAEYPVRQPIKRTAFDFRQLVEDLIARRVADESAEQDIVSRHRARQAFFGRSNLPPALEETTRRLEAWLAAHKELKSDKPEEASEK